MSSKSVPEPPARDRHDRPPRRPWSLAARLTIWYAGSALLMVLLVTAYLYWALVRNVDREDDALLADKVRSLRTVIVQKTGNEAALRREVEDMWGPRQNIKIYARIVGEGRVLAESPGMDRLVPEAAFPPPEADPGRGADVQAGGGTYRVQAVRGTGSPWLVQAALDRSMEVEILSEYRTNLGYVLAVALVACAAVGYLIAHRGLRPVHQITETARRIRPANLGERIDPEGLPAELHTLAATFNGMLDRLEQSFGRLARFSADIAHELRTPVFNLRGEVEVALGKPRSDEEYREVLASNLEECGRLAHIIDRLLFLARAEHPEAQLAREPCDVGAELATVCEFYEAAAAEAGVRLHVGARGRVSADLDRSLFQRAVGNLVANALAHTPPGGTITLTASEIGTATVVEEADTGCGIAAEHLPHVFDRFFRADLSRTSGRGGVGLGLSIVRSIAALHGGTAEVASEAGRGARFTLIFPRLERPIGDNTPEIMRPPR